jgi:hypothetical protein
LAYNRLLIFIFCLLFNSAAFSLLKDPTKPFSGATHSISSPEVEVGLKLSAIFIYKQSKYATINGITAKEGQVILSAIKILKILNNSVKVLYKGSIQTLYLLTPFKKKQVDLKKSDRNE